MTQRKMQCPICEEVTIPAPPHAPSDTAVIGPCLACKETKSITMVRISAERLEELVQAAPQPVMVELSAILAVIEEWEVAGRERIANWEGSTHGKEQLAGYCTALINLAAHLRREAFVDEYAYNPEKEDA